MMSVTYSPEDNKLRLCASTRLDPELYARVSAAGFKWAPKQELFIAPMWTPEREDLALELCGEIGDEDSSLMDRAETRAERFEEYSEHRAADADAAHKTVERITSGIPFGQPILVGHHSERHARKDQERIHNGMSRAVKNWETARYWEGRAAAAIQHAKYKERPDVRARRIKTIEADKRKQERIREKAVDFARLWELLTKAKEGGSTPDLLERARALANLDSVYVARKEGGQARDMWSAYHVLRPDGERYRACPSMTPEEVRTEAMAAHGRVAARCDRWITHYSNRLAYERAMLAADGGTVADKTGPEVGGGCRCWASPGGGWSLIQKVNKVSVSVTDAPCFNSQRLITMPFDKLTAVMSKAEVEAARADKRLVESKDHPGYFFLRDPKGDSTESATVRLV